ncbi:MAG: hypothetical protein ACRDGA_03420, partial [Bacteroidota bacterium]
MNRLILTVAVTAGLSFLFNTCKNIGVEPPTGVDTTSHDFAWQTFVLGDGGGSILRDVAIINDTLAYAVGEINKKDSAGQWENPPYGLAIWDGHTWTLKRIYARYPNSNTPLRPTGIFAFSPTDVWLAWGDVFQWDGHGENVTIHRLTVEVTNPNPVLSPNQGITKLWGTSKTKVYGCGTNGALAFFNGTSWQKLESGTSFDIYDIWGEESTGGGEEILAVAGKRADHLDRRILQVNSTGASTVSDSGISSQLVGVWFSSRNQYYA